MPLLPCPLLILVDLMISMADCRAVGGRAVGREGLREGGRGGVEGGREGGREGKREGEAVHPRAPLL